MIASRSSKFLVGINTLIGGVLIVSTVVVGAVTLNVTHPVHLNKLDFLRDMGFLLVMLTVVLVAVVWNPSALIISAVLLVCYVGYIVLVFHRGDSAQLHYEALEHEALEHPHNVLFDQYSDVDDAASTSAQCGDRCYQRVDRLYALVELPVRVLQHSTIPLLESTADNLSIWQYYRWAYPIAVPGLLGLWLSTSDYGSTVEMYLTLALCVLVSIILALSLYILPAPIVPIVRTAPDKWGDFPGNEHYHSSRMYLQRTSLYIWLFVAFCSCIMWIDLTANALVAALSLLGDTIGIPKEFLGLTVLGQLSG
jgi:Ca2+/Na+ antiporter